MIRIDLGSAVAIYSCFTIFLVIATWVFYNCSKNQAASNDQNYLQQCKFCMHVFFNYQNKEIIVCPLCKSLIQADKREGEIGKTSPC